MRTTPAGIVALVLLAGLFAVWAWQYGGFFGTALYPGTAALTAGLVLLTLFAPVRVRLRGWPAVALGALIALGLWAALSAVWSPAPDEAIEDAQRILTYAMAFGLGLWTCALLKPLVHLAMVPVAFAGLFAGIVAVVVILTGDEVREILDQGTLQYPLGYRNANAAFFLIAAWPAVGLAASQRLDWRARGLALATATLCFQLAALAQSRGSALGAAVALIVYLVVSDDRARGVGWLLLAVLPALLVVPALTDLYRTVGDVGPEGALPELRAAGRAVIWGSALALVLGVGAALLERRYPPSPSLLRRANRGVAAAAALIAAVSVAGFVVVTGDPAGWIGDRADEFLTQSSPESAGSSRFGFDAGTERDDLWRVALDDAGEDPLLGTGAGGFYYSYLQDRTGEGVESARDAHSLELEVLGELGVSRVRAPHGGPGRGRVRGAASQAHGRRGRGPGHDRAHGGRLLADARLIGLVFSHPGDHRPRPHAAGRRQCPGAYDRWGPQSVWSEGDRCRRHRPGPQRDRSVPQPALPRPGLRRLERRHRAGL